MYPVNDPQAVRDPRPDIGYYTSGLNGLQLTETTSPNPNSTGVPLGGSRVIQWGWNAVGLNDPFNLEVNKLVGATAVGTVTITTT
jgi:hypothetical protein